MIRSFPRKLYLASRSPRRHELLSKAGIDFEAIHVKVSEKTPRKLTSPLEICEIAGLKARAAVASLSQPLGWVLGGDTVVVLPSGEVLGKPRSEVEARHMLRSLSGETHYVITGLAGLFLPERLMVFGWSITSVTFRELFDNEIADYVASGEPLDKAGSYAIQGEGRKFVVGWQGPYDNVVGLPIDLVRYLMKWPMEGESLANSQAIEPRILGSW